MLGSRHFLSFIIVVRIPSGENILTIIRSHKMELNGPDEVLVVRGSTFFRESNQLATGVYQFPAVDGGDEVAASLTSSLSAAPGPTTFMAVRTGQSTEVSTCCIPVCLPPVPRRAAPPSRRSITESALYTRKGLSPFFGCVVLIFAAK